MFSIQTTRPGVTSQPLSKMAAGMRLVPIGWKGDRIGPAPVRGKQVPLIERFAQLHGFKREGDKERFCHPDGRWLQKDRGGTFPWKMYSMGGELLKCILDKEHCITEEPLEIGAVLWDACRRNPNSHSLLITRADGSPLELSGRCLLDLTDENLLVLYPATYRLVCQTDEGRLEGLG